MEDNMILFTVFIICLAILIATWVVKDGN